ncbi:MAG: type II toxin-antitoxin system PemK/MazF family toxin [Egibacteraceae bacterium]
MVRRGGVYFIEHPDWGRRLVVVLTRDAAIPVLKRVTIATISRRIRGIPTEVVLDEEDGMPARCAVSLDNLGEAWKVMLVDPVTTLGYDRMRQVCQALSQALGC